MRHKGENNRQEQKQGSDNRGARGSSTCNPQASRHIQWGYCKLSAREQCALSASHQVSSTSSSCVSTMALPGYRACAVARASASLRPTTHLIIAGGRV